MTKPGIVVALVVAVAAGCAARGEPRPVTQPRSLAEHRARWAEERRALDEQLDTLEERLLTDQARVRFWHEMRDRHESVTAVACTNLGHHAEAVASYAGKQREKTAALGRRNRVAANFVAGNAAVR